MVDSQKLIVTLLVLAILFSVASIMISLGADDIDITIPDPEVSTNVVKIAGSGGSGVGLSVEGGGA